MRKRQFRKGLNVAVLKSILVQLPKEEFIAYAIFFGQQAKGAECSSKRHQMYEKLYFWCKAYYKQHHLS